MWITLLPARHCRSKPNGPKQAGGEAMDFIQEDGYEVRFGMEEEYQQWIVDNAADIRRSLPKGVEYIGSYVMTWGNDAEKGSWRDLWRLDRYAALDRLSDEAKDPNSAMGRLLREQIQFLDMSRGPEHWSHNLLKSVIDATVINSPVEEAREFVGAGR